MPLPFRVVVALCAANLAAVVGARAPALAASGSDDLLPARPGSDTTLAFVGVGVVPMDRERLLENQTVLVEGGRIVAIGTTGHVAVPAEALVIDGSGRFLVPGLAEMHAHIPNPNGPGGAVFMENVLFLYLARGVTTVRGMLGQPEHLELRARVERGDLLAPRVYTSGPSLNGNSVPGPDVARQMVVAQKQAGYDFLKLHPGLSRASYDAIVAAADSVEIEFAGHVSADVGLERSLAAGQATIDHLDGYAEALLPDPAAAAGSGGLFGFALTEQLEVERIPAVAKATVEAEVWNVPTQSLIENVLAPEDAASMAEWPRMRYMPAPMVDSWVDSKNNFLDNPSYSPQRALLFIEIRRRLIKGLHDAGAGLLLGSDAPQVFQVPGYSALDELEILVDSGLTPYEALATGTRNVAVFLGELDASGTVEEGKVADLILVEENPLDDIANIRSQAGVVVRGRWLPQAEIEARLEAIARSYGN